MKKSEIDIGCGITGPVLVYGFGNPGRQDDGFGHSMVLEVESWACDHLSVDFNYQLNIEDAEVISHHGTVIFVDASISLDRSYRFYELEPSMEGTFSTHAVPPSYVLGLCHSVYLRKPKAYMLEVRGQEWELKEGFSSVGIENYRKALRFLRRVLKGEDDEQ